MQNLPLVHFRLTLRGRNIPHPAKSIVNEDKAPTVFE